jgi:hypothetical protein
MQSLGIPTTQTLRRNINHITQSKLRTSYATRQIENVSEPEYRITGQPSLEGLTFTGSSKEYLEWPKAVKFCADKNSVLQSLREAVGFRAEANGADDADKYQVTRTVAVYFTDKSGKRYVAFDDIADPKKNIILARVREGYDACEKKNVWHLPMNDKHVKQIMARAEKDGRVIEVPEAQEWPLKDTYATQPLVKASMGDMAEANAQFLIGKGHKNGRVWTPEQTSEDKADVRAVGLGGGYNDLGSGVGADWQFDDGGRARGVASAQKNLQSK